jgi:hypothetical protein
MKDSGICHDGANRLREVFEAEVRLEYEKELLSAKSFWQRLAVRMKIRREVKARILRAV